MCLFFKLYTAVLAQPWHQADSVHAGESEMQLEGLQVKLI